MKQIIKVSFVRKIIEIKYIHTHLYTYIIYVRTRFNNKLYFHYEKLHFIDTTQFVTKYEELVIN